MESELMIFGVDGEQESGVGHPDPVCRARTLRRVAAALDARAGTEGQPRLCANGIEAVDRHLDRLLAAVRQPGTPRVAQALDGVCEGCAGCPQSLMTCPLIARGTCIILRDADTIVGALAEALREVKDPQYLQNHPNGL
jgi:hypothetical protein